MKQLPSLLYSSCHVCSEKGLGNRWSLAKVYGRHRVAKRIFHPLFPAGENRTKKCLFHFFVTGALKGDRTESGFILTQKFNPFPSPVHPPSPYLEGCSEGWEPRVFFSPSLTREGRTPPSLLCLPNGFLIHTLGGRA